MSRRPVRSQQSFSRRDHHVCSHRHRYGSPKALGSFRTGFFLYVRQVRERESWRSARGVRSDQPQTECTRAWSFLAPRSEDVKKSHVPRQKRCSLFVPWQSRKPRYRYRQEAHRENSLPGFVPTQTFIIARYVPLDQLREPLNNNNQRPPWLAIPRCCTNDPL